MPLTREFKECVVEIAHKDPEFRRGLLRSAVELVFEGEFVAGKFALRDYINATGVMDDLCKDLGKHKSSIRRMLGSGGSPTLENFVNITRVCAEKEGMKIKICGLSEKCGGV